MIISFIHRLRVLLIAVTLVPSMLLFAQIKPVAGMHQNTPAVHAFTNAKIVIAPGNVINKGTLVIRDGMITAVGTSVAIPADARVWDMAGMTLYPGLIDSYSDIGMPKKAQPGQGRRSEQQPPAPEQPRGAKHWNDLVNSSLNADELFVPDANAAENSAAWDSPPRWLFRKKGIFPRHERYC